MKSAIDARIRELFGFTPTDDFHLFWEFAQSIRPTDPHRAFSETMQITLVGPFDLVAGRFDNQRAHYDPCLHWRYFGDPPEFVTILVGGGDGHHWGYLTDRPDRPPLGTVAYYAYDDVSVFQASDSLFGVLQDELNATLDSLDEEAEQFPEDADDIQSRRPQFEVLLEATDAFCSRHNLRIPETQDLECIDEWNPPFPFEVPDPEEFHKFPSLINEAIKELTASGCSIEDARLKLGRILWHWHNDGDSQIEQLAFDLLNSCYESQKASFLQHVLREHRQHRHRKSLDVFDE